MPTLACTEISDCIQGAVWTWIEWKQWIKSSVGYKSDSLHVLWGVAIQFAVALAIRRSLASFLPWLLLLGLAGANELVDMWAGPKIDYLESAKDVFLTMLLPTVLLVTTRRFPELYRPAS